MIKIERRVFCDWCKREIEFACIEIVARRIGHFRTDGNNCRWFHGINAMDSDDVDLHFCMLEHLSLYVKGLQDREAIRASMI